jgi:hypothetical protein
MPEFWFQRGDPTYKKAWQKICEVSRAEYNKVYQRLGVRLEEKVRVLVSFESPMRNSLSLFCSFNLVMGLLELCVPYICLFCTNSVCWCGFYWMCCGFDYVFLPDIPKVWLVAWFSLLFFSDVVIMTPLFARFHVLALTLNLVSSSIKMDNAYCVEINRISWVYVAFIIDFHFY